MKVEKFVLDDGRVELIGIVVAELEAEGHALAVISCDPRRCTAQHFHLVAKDDDGTLVMITTFDSVDLEGIARSGFLFRALVAMVTGEINVDAVEPKGVITGTPVEGPAPAPVIPGWTPMGEA